MNDSCLQGRYESSAEDDGKDEYDDAVAFTYDENPLRVRGVQVCIVLTYAIILTFSMISNIMIIVAIMITKKLRTGSNMLVLNLGLADIVYCISGMIFTPLSLIVKVSFIEWASCIWIQMLDAVSVHVISLTTMAIAVDRCLRLSALRRPMHMLPALITNMVIWFSAALFCIPVGRHVTLDEWGQCTETWTEAETVVHYLYLLCVDTVQFIMPATIIVVCYVRVTRYFKFRYQAVYSNTRTCLSERRQIIGSLQRKKNMSTLAIVIISCFVIGFTPITILYSIAEINSDIVYCSPNSLIVFIVVHALASASTIANPVVYGCLNTNFQRCIKQHHLFGRILGSERWSVSAKWQRTSTTNCQAAPSFRPALRQSQYCKNDPWNDSTQYL
jgi:galanin receptor 2